MRRVLVIGAGNIGLSIAKFLMEKGFRITVMDIDEKAVDRILEHVGFEVDFVHGDAENPNDLKRAKVSEMDVVIAATGNDKTNIIAAFLAKKLGAKDVIVKINRPELCPSCARLGLVKVLDISRLVTIAVDSMLHNGNILQALDEIGETIELNVRRVGEDLDGVQLDGTRIPDTDYVVLAVKRNERWRLPKPNCKLKAGDVILVAREEIRGAIDEIKDVVKSEFLSKLKKPV